MRAFFLSIMFVLYLRFFGWTSKVTYIGEENIPDKPYMYIFWHSYILLVSYSHRGRAVRVLASTSKDGDVSAFANSIFGHRIIRGTASSTKEGAKTTIKIIRSLKEGNVVAITPDGPKGPALKAKNGVAYIAKKVNCPVVPVAWYAKRKIRLKSWDKTIVPLPFNKAVIMTGEPVYMKPNDDIETSIRNIESALNKLDVEVKKISESQKQ